MAPRTTIAAAALATLAFAPSVLAVSLIDFTPRLSNLPPGCEKIYTSPIPGCQPTDFQTGSCSQQCISGLASMEQPVKQACGNAGISGSNILAAFLAGQGPPSLCPNDQGYGSASGSSSSASQSSAPSSTVSSAAASSTTAQSTTTSESAPTTTAESSSASVSETTTLLFTSTITAASESPMSSITMDTSSPPPEATGSSTTSSASHQQTGNAGTPFGTSNADTLTLPTWLAVLSPLLLTVLGLA